MFSVCLFGVCNSVFRCFGVRCLMSIVCRFVFGVLLVFAIGCLWFVLVVCYSLFVVSCL